MNDTNIQVGFIYARFKLQDSKNFADILIISRNGYKARYIREKAQIANFKSLKFLRKNSNLMDLMIKLLKKYDRLSLRL